jgi:hypothetical protein
MKGTLGEWQPAQLREFRAEFLANPALCERALAFLGEPAREPERVLIRSDAESIDLARARALALAVNGGVCRLELTHEGGKGF